MKKAVAIVLLGVALVGSNVWWLIDAIDGGLSYTYLSVSFDANRTALAQALALLPVVARCGASRAEVIAAAALPGEPAEPFEKDGFVFTGRIGIKFDDNGRLVEVVRGWSPPLKAAGSREAVLQDYESISPAGPASTTTRRRA